MLTRTEHTQREKLSRPQFNESKSEAFPTQYACTLTVDGGPAEPFGSETLFPTKQGAKATAAKEAVLWLRESGKLPPAGTKRRKILDPKDLHEGNTGLTQILGGLGMDSRTSLPQRVSEMAGSLGFRPPSYDFDPSTAASGQAVPTTGYWDVAVTFDNRDVAKESRLAGRIGEVKHIYGKGKAKNACCEKVIQLLESLASGRNE